MPVVFLAFAICGLAACSEDPTRPVPESSAADFAIESVEAAVAKQTGIVAREGKPFAHRCRSGEVSFRIDGIEVDQDVPRARSGRPRN